MAYKNIGKLLNLKSYANKHLICIRNIAGHTAANWRVKKLNLNTISVSKWHIKIWTRLKNGFVITLTNFCPLML